MATEDFPGLDATARAMVRRTFGSLTDRGVTPIYVPDSKAALAKLLDIIPTGAAVVHGSSTTLQQVGFVDRLKVASSGYRYLNAEWPREAEPAKRGRLRVKLSADAEYFLGSVQAIAETGEVVGADASGSRQASYVFGPPHVIWVAGINKLVPSLADGIRRVREVALPLEDQRMKKRARRIVASESW